MQDSSIAQVLDDGPVGAVLIKGRGGWISAHRVQVIAKFPGPPMLWEITTVNEDGICLASFFCPAEEIIGISIRRYLPNGQE